MNSKKSKVQPVELTTFDFLTEKEVTVKVDPRALIKGMLSAIGEDPNREGLLETPDRVVRSWKELYGGYKQSPSKFLKVFDSESYDQMIVLKNCEFWSTCEHHMLGFYGRAHVGYIPGRHVIGLSKLARLVETYSRRLQIQERLTQQIALTLMDGLGASGAGCIITAKHSCMCSRGVGKQHSEMTTSSLLGNFMDAEVRAEFQRLVGEI